MDGQSAPLSPDRGEISKWGDSPDGRIAALGAAQHGVISRTQLHAIHLGRGAVDHRVRVGRLHPVHRGVYAVGHPLLACEGRWMAAVLACGPGAALSHRSAGALSGLHSTESATVDVTVPSRNGRRPSPRITVHRSRMLSAADIVHQCGIPVTTPARTLLDLSELISESALERAVERAEARRLIDFRALRAMLAAKPTRAGSSALARVVDRYQIDASVTRSELEDLFLDLCATHGLPRPVVNARVRGYEVDFLWRDERVIIETDGRSTHATRAAFERDRARDAQLVVAGYRVVRFTYRQVKRAPDGVADVVRSLLSRAGAQPPERSISSIR